MRSNVAWNTVRRSAWSRRLRALALAVSMCAVTVVRSTVGLAETVVTNNAAPPGDFGFRFGDHQHSKESLAGAEEREREGGLLQQVLSTVLPILMTTLLSGQKGDQGADSKSSGEVSAVSTPEVTSTDRRSIL